MHPSGCCHQGNQYRASELGTCACRRVEAFKHSAYMHATLHASGRDLGLWRQGNNNFRTYICSNPKATPSTCRSPCNLQTKICWRTPSCSSPPPNHYKRINITTSHSALVQAYLPNASEVAAAALAICRRRSAGAPPAGPPLIDPLELNDCADQLLACAATACRPSAGLAVDEAVLAGGSILVIPMSSGSSWCTAQWMAAHCCGMHNRKCSLLMGFQKKEKDAAV